MALHQLGKVLVTSDYNVGGNAWLEGDTFVSSYDDVLDSIVVFKNDETVAETDGELLVFQVTGKKGQKLNGSFYTRAYDNFTYNNGAILINFLITSEFPYFKSNQEEIVIPTGSNNLKLKSITVTKASAKGVADAVISIEASGDNTIEWGLGTFNYGNGTAVGTSISSVYSGNYTVWLIDSLGFKINRQIYIGYNIGSYGAKWYFDEKSNIGDDFRTEILEKSYAGSSTEITGAGNGFSLSVNSKGSDFYDSQIISGSASLSLISDSRGKYAAIARDGDEEKYLVKRYKDVASSWVLQWQGFVTPSSYSEEYGQTPYVTNVTAHDRLADLKNVKFLNEASENDDSKTDFNKLVLGEISQLQALNFCLSKLNQGFGYRVALPIFETSHTKTPGNTPLEQTYFVPDFYANIKDNGYNPDNCDKVVRDILKTYKAHIQARDGYWYIIAWDAMLSSSISYVEFDSALTQTGTGSWSPIIDYKLPSESTRWRWVGGRQSLSFTDIYKRINLKLNTELKENGGLSPFNENTIVYPNPESALDVGDAIGFSGVSLVKGNPLTSFPFKRDSLNDYNYAWKTRISDRVNSESYLYWGGNDLEYSATDKLRISVDIEPILDLPFTPSPYFNLPESKSIELPYLTFKWSFSLDSKYLTSAGTWSDTAVVNEYFLEPEGEQKFSIEASYRDVASTIGDYNLKFYVPTIYEAHYSNANRTSMFTSFRDESTTTLVSGTRRICRYGSYDQTGSDLVTVSSGYQLYFYELAEYDAADSVPAEAVPTIIEPDDYDDDDNRVKWELVKVLTFNYLNTQQIGADFYNAKLEHLPGGLNAENERTISQINNLNNKLELDYELNLYDLDGTTTNDENTYVNYLKDSSSAPTVSWVETGETVTKIIQKHVLDWIVGLTKKARNRIQGSITSDTQITSLNVLRDSDDNNRIYYPLKMNYGDYRNEYNGEALELGSDDVETTEAHSTGHKNSAHT